MRKSLFNGSIYKTWIRRYWVGSLIMVLFFSILGYSVGNSASKYPKLIEEPATFIYDSGTAYIISLFVMCAAIVASVLCHSYMQNLRSAIMMHSLPAKRAELFRSVSAAGLTLLLAPIIYGGALFSIIGAFYNISMVNASLIWVLIMSACVVIIYGISSIAASITGNIFAQGILTALIISLPYIIESTIYSLAKRFLFGFNPDNYFSFSSVATPYIVTINYFRNLEVPASRSFTNIFIVPAVFFLLGAIFLFIGSRLYNIRKTEAAGDVIAMKAIRPVVLYGATVVFAVYIGRILINILSLTSFALELTATIFCGIVGYFATLMLINKTVKVFKQYKGILVFSLAVSVVLVLAQLDISGYSKHKLDVSEVEMISIGSVDNRIVAAFTGRQLNINDFLLDLDLPNMPETIDQLYKHTNIDINPEIANLIIEKDHRIYKTGDNLKQAVMLQNMIAENSRLLIDNTLKNINSYEDYYYIEVYAKLKNGKVFSRKYYFSIKNLNMDDLVTQYSKMEAINTIAHSTNLTAAAPKCKNIYMSYYENSGYVNNTGTGFAPMIQGDKCVEFCEEYTADLKNLYKQNPLYNSPDNKNTPVAIPGLPYLVVAEMSFDKSVSEYFYVSPDHKNTINWMLKNNLLTQKAIDNYMDSSRLEQQESSVDPEVP